MTKYRLKESAYLPHQWQFLNSNAKTVGLIGGLGSGKTAAFLYKAFIAHVSRPGANGRSNLGIGYPSHGLGKMLFYYPFCDILEQAGIKYKANVSDLSIESAYGRARIMSMHTPERIIGETFTDVGLDEIDTLPMPKGMLVVKRFRERMRGRTDSQLFMVSSPEGFSTCYNVLKERPNPGTELIHADTRTNTYLPHSYIDDIMATYDEQMAKAYIQGQFVNLNSMQAHYAFNRDLHVHPVMTPEPGTELLIGIDFNVTPMTAAIGYMRIVDGQEHYYFFNEFYKINSNTYQLADWLHEYYADNYIVTCYPDPTGIARKTASDTSDLDILKRRGFNMKYKHGITQRRSLNIANGALAHNRIHIDPKCKHMIADLEQVVTDETGDIEKPTGTMLTHISDAMRNIIVVDTMRKQQQKNWDVA